MKILIIVPLLYGCAMAAIPVALLAYVFGLYSVANLAIWAFFIFLGGLLLVLAVGLAVSLLFQG